ncbi:hypothetical protein BDD12DRAFT_917355 [Trichophaea hybrida]|nr:hypothetical protein BDD12DRAFT_917355 [Trichophaea hybrida]
MVLLVIKLNLYRFITTIYSTAFLLHLLPVVAIAQDTRPLVESNKLRRVLTRSDLLVQANKLLEFAFTPGAGGNRGFGGQGHNSTINYIYNTIKALDEYDVYLQPFTQRYAAANESFLVDGDEAVFYPARGSPAVKGLKADLAAVRGEGCSVIVILKRGNCTITYKSQLAGAAGTVATIVFNNVPGTVLDGCLLDEPGIIPTGAISNAYEAKSISIHSRRIVTYNVIAQTKSGDQSNVVLVGAHLDSVPLGPGINDNSSNTIALLKVLLKLKNFKTNNAIRFCWFSAEEFGLLGKNLKIRLMLNFDMIGSPNYILGVYDGDGSAIGLAGPQGSAQIEKKLEEYFQDVGKPSVPTAFTGRSDYGSFLAANIPAGGLFTDAKGIKTTEEQKLFEGVVGVPYDANYHQPGDDIKDLDLGALIVNPKAIANCVAVFGRSLEGFPERTMVKAGEKVVVWSEGSHGKFASHGDGGCGDGLY